MNIFFLDHNPKICATYHTDKHVVKMILETAQLLSTAHRVLDGDDKKQLQNPEKNSMLYKATHIYHPSSEWVRESKEHYDWTYSLFIQLCQEYTHRYCKIHKTQRLSGYLKDAPKNISKKPWKNPPAVMPAECLVGDCVIENYRNYYNLKKSFMFKFTKRNKPEWAIEQQNLGV